MRVYLCGSAGVLLGMLITMAFGFGFVDSAGENTTSSDAPQAVTQPATSTQSTAPSTAPAAKRAADDGKLRIIAFGGHPDDCEIRTGGAGALWAEAGHHVKFVSATNGDIGHFRMAGGPLAKRRNREVQQAAKILGVTTQVLDIHDGELMPTLENRRTFTRQIRRWKADIVLSHRPNDYHPDHRYTGVLVQDSAYMVAVPFICPDAPHLTRNPVFLFYWDRFERPNAFRPDVAVSIDSVIEKKLDALAVMKSQFFEGGAMGYTRPPAKTEEQIRRRHREVRERFKARFAANAKKYRDKLIELYGEKAGRNVRYAEAFEVCEYGRRPSREELLKLFPFFPEGGE